MAVQKPTKKDRKIVDVFSCSSDDQSQRRDDSEAILVRPYFDVLPFSQGESIRGPSTILSSAWQSTGIIRVLDEYQVEHFSFLQKDDRSD